MLGDRLGRISWASRRRAIASGSRFIVAPDKVLAAGDPIAQNLLVKYKKVLMPNLGLGPADAEILIGGK